jgi:hypothetical protein
MSRLSRRTLLAALIAVLATSCIGRTLPLPPPGVTAQAFTDCDMTTCPMGGLVVDLSGTSEPGALVVAENLSRGFVGGARFSASAWATDPGGGGDGGADAGALQGMWRIRLAPLPDPMGPVVATQHGDRLDVRQFVRNSDGNYEPSTSVIVTVP